MVRNSDLFDNKSCTILQQTPREDSFVIVSKDVWKQLLDWFGGGPETAMRALKNKDKLVKVASRGRTVRVVCESDKKRFRRFLFSEDDTVATLKQKVCEVFELDPSQCRIHDFYQYKPFCRIDTSNHLKLTLPRKHILHDNLIFIELADEEGYFRIEYAQHTFYNTSIF